MKFKYFKIALLALVGFGFTSCMDNDDEPDYSQWLKENTSYLANIESDRSYEKIVPAWAPNSRVYMKWHNDRSLTAKNLVPLDNSTCDVKYEFRLINDSIVDSSYARTTYGDSIARFRPNQTIAGFRIALTNMHVGDSVTLVIPYQEGYGAGGNTTVPPFSTLIYNLKLVDIPAWEIPT